LQCDQIFKKFKYFDFSRLFYFFLIFLIFFLMFCGAYEKICHRIHTFLWHILKMRHENMRILWLIWICAIEIKFSGEVMWRIPYAPWSSKSMRRRSASFLVVMIILYLRISPILCCCQSYKIN
jgi:hypothetical protein